MCKNNWTKLDFLGNNPSCSCGRSHSTNTASPIADFKVYDATFVYRVKNAQGGVNETVVRAGVLARNFEDINNLVNEQIAPQIPKGATLVSVEIRSV